MKIPLHESWVGGLLGILTMPFAFATAIGIAMTPYWIVGMISWLLEKVFA